MQTQAAVLYAIDQPLKIADLTLPSLKPGQVLVEVAFTGICHSQLLEVQGKRGPDRFVPHTLGHEGSCIVIEVGPDVTKVSVGDHVVLTWIKGSGSDVPSTVYEDSGGKVNSGAISTFMRHTITCENRLVPIPPQMPLREAALLGCAIPTGAGVVFNTAKVQPGKSIAIFGIGGIGMSAICAAQVAGAQPIIAVDIMDHKLRKAEALGATHSINAQKENALEAIMKITSGTGTDYSIEAAGLTQTMEMAFQSVCSAGGLCVLAGNLPAGQRISLDPFDLIRGKRIVGTWGGEVQPDRDIPRYVDLWLSGKLGLERFITHEYPLEEINQALDDLEKGKVGRALVNNTRRFR